jgi:hypothetical protein
MPFRKFGSSVSQSLAGAGKIIKDTLRVLRNHPEIAIYPYSALLFISITYPLVSATIFAHWYSRIFTDAGSVAPHHLRIILGLVGFSAFYTALVTAYFTCAVSAGVLAKLEDRPTSPLYGLRQVWQHFFRVTRFAVLSVFFFPAGLYAQREKLPRGIIGILGSSFTLHMAQMAPAILTSKKGLGATIRNSVDTMGKLWREGLVLKIGMYVCIFVVVIAPKLVQHGFFKSHKANDVGWLISLELAASSYVTFKVINSIFTTVLYHQAKTQQK